MPDFRKPHTLHWMPHQHISASVSNIVEEVLGHDAVTPSMLCQGLGVHQPQTIPYAGPCHNQAGNKMPLSTPAWLKVL